MGEHPPLGHPHDRQGVGVHPLPAEQLPQIGQGPDMGLEPHNHFGQHPARLLRMLREQTD